jgi:hypothetical protein
MQALPVLPVHPLSICLLVVGDWPLSRRDAAFRSALKWLCSHVRVVTDREFERAGFGRAAVGIISTTSAALSVDTARGLPLLAMGTAAWNSLDLAREAYWLGGVAAVRVTNAMHALSARRTRAIVPVYEKPGSLLVGVPCGGTRVAHAASAVAWAGQDGGGMASIFAYEVRMCGLCWMCDRMRLNLHLHLHLNLTLTLR